MIRSAQFLTLAITLLAPVAAEAAPSRVALLGPNDAPVLARLERNVASLKLDMVKGTVTVCTRDVVTRLLNELRVDTAICTDGDQIGVWLKAGDRLTLKESVVLQGTDDRAQELAAARAVMALQALPAKDASDGTVATAPSTPGGFTIVANGSEAIIQANNGPQASPPSESPAPVVDRPPVVPPKQPERVTPRFVLGVGPGIAASRHGGSFAVSAEAEIGVSRYVALVPWLQFVPENRIAEAPLGTASFRPTIFGFGINIPLLPPTSMFVPRLGTGYGILWLHVAPETATAPATPRKPEDLLAPIMYGTVALSVKVAPSFRVVGEGMAGVASNDMVVRIANEKAAHWGVPVAGLSLRGEWVVQ